MNKFYVFGDSHSLCFKGVVKKVYYYHASSAKGLSNKKSESGTNEKVCKLLKNIEKGANVLFYFGKVDMDFVLNYKYNVNLKIDYNNYIIEIVRLYVNFIKNNAINKKVYICELPIPHLNDKNLLTRINNENTMKNINSHLSNRVTPPKINKVINYAKRLKYYMLFNKELRKECKKNKIRMLEINKYFLNDKGEYKIPLKYINRNKLDHHLRNNVRELFVHDYKKRFMNK